MQDHINAIEEGMAGQTSHKLESFKYQLDCLKIEIDLIDRAIARFDQITQTTKNWAVVTWTGSIALVLGRAEIRKYIILTAVLPLLFWFIDAWWRLLQKRSILRQQKISEFLNDGRLGESFKQQRLIEFTVLDPVGRQYLDTQEYRSATRVGRTILYPEISLFYGGLAFISLAVGVLFLFVL
jgi:hypothetical protein